MGTKGSKKQIRKLHVGKSPSEREQYKRLLEQPRAQIDETNSDADKSIFDITKQAKNLDVLESSPIDKEKPKKKTKRGGYTYLQVGDFVAKHFFTIFIVGVLCLVVSTVWNQNRELGVISTKLDGVTKDIDSMDKKYEKLEEGGSSGNVSLAQIRADLSYLKERIANIERKFSN